MIKSYMIVITMVQINFISNFFKITKEGVLLSSVQFNPSVLSDSFVDHDGYSISSKGFLPTVVDIMVI